MRLYVSTDGGRRWGLTTIPTAMEVSTIFTLDDRRFLMLSSSVMYLLTLTDERPFLIESQSISTKERLGFALSWTDPSNGRFTGGVIERAYSDSVWMTIGGVAVPDQYYIDTMLLRNEPLRYRVTLETPEGPIQQTSDEIIPVPEGDFFDFFSYLLPGHNRLLRYQFNYIRYEGGVNIVER